MLKHNEPYRYARPELMREKFAKLQPLGGETQGGSGQTRPRAEGRPGLAEVYEAAGLPAVTGPEELPPGERQMLTERELDEFVTEWYRPAQRAGSGRRAAGGRQGRGKRGPERR